jgi:hypothetical protein
VPKELKARPNNERRRLGGRRQRAGHRRYEKKGSGKCPPFIFLELIKQYYTKHTTIYKYTFLFFLLLLQLFKHIEHIAGMITRIDRIKEWLALNIYIQRQMLLTWPTP